MSAEQAFRNSRNGRTSDGYPIRAGLKVWTNDLVRGVVMSNAPDIEADGTPWFRVDCDGKCSWFDGWRMTTRHPFTGERA